MISEKILKATKAMQKFTQACNGLSEALKDHKDKVQARTKRVKND